ncbi:hypothetical protein J2T13_002500 [Paenibacillus sp. DS2015]
MNKRVTCIVALALIIVFTVACGQKPLSGTDSQSSSNTVNSSNNIATDNKEGNSTNADIENPTVVDSTEPVIETTPPAKATDSDSKEEAQEGDTVAGNKQSETITSYYTDSQAMELVKSQQEIQYSNDIEKYIAAFETLQIDSNPEFIPLWGKVELKSLTSSNGELSIDIHLPDEARLGSGGEMFALEALQNTLFQFKEVKSIDLTVDGESSESLMGHVELEHPMVRN